MPVIVETGTGTNPAANSYADETELATFASDRGVTLAGDPTVLLINAMDYVEANRDTFKGTKTSQTQPLQWPRVGVYVDGFEVASDEIPVDLKRAQMQAAIESDGAELSPTQGAAVKREKVDVLEIEYEAGGSTKALKFPKVDAYLDALTSGSGGTIRLGVLR